MLRGANVQAKSLLLLVMFKHWRAVRSRGLAENVLCHICCAPVLMYNRNFTEFSGVPLSFLFALLLSRKSPGSKLCHFCRIVKGYRINTDPRWSRLVSGTGQWGAEWKGARDIFILLAFFILSGFTFQEACTKPMWAISISYCFSPRFKTYSSKLSWGVISLWLPFISVNLKRKFASYSGNCHNCLSGKAEERLTDTF